MDQTGFAPGREVRDNTTRAHNIIHHCNTTTAMLLSTDAEKAFDRVSWGFMRGVLRHIGIGKNVMKGMEALYDYPRPVVKSNGLLSANFSLANTLARAALFHHFFILTLEPLLRYVSSNPDITGVQVGRTSHKIAAFADDLLFFYHQLRNIPS